MARFGFVTCVQLGLGCVEELVALGADLVYLGTLKDHIAPNKSGRVRLDDLAMQNGIPLAKFENINDDRVITEIEAAELDWLFVIGWSQMVTPRVLRTPRLGVVGMHPTLLPEGRGRAAIPWAIIKGLPETGVTMFKLDEGMDTGPVLGQVRIPIEQRETSATLYEKAEAAHRKLIRDTYPGLANQTISMHEQDESRATQWPGRRPSDGELDLTRLDARTVDRYVRALTHPYPGAFVRVGQHILRVWRGELGELQLPGALPLTTRAGAYTATEYQWEDLA